MSKVRICDCCEQRMDKDFITILRRKTFQNFLGYWTTEDYELCPKCYEKLKKMRK